MKQEQPDECYKHHMLLKKMLDEMHDFLFGDLKHTNDVSFVSKVNLMFQELNFIKHILIGSITAILAGCLFIGRQLYCIEETSKNLNSYMENSKTMEIKLAQIEEKIKGIKWN